MSMYGPSWRDDLYGDYIDTGDDLMHYGVLGMRWGHRKGSSGSSSARQRLENWGNDARAKKIAGYKNKAQKVAERSKKRQEMIDKYGDNKATRILFDTDGQRYYKKYDADRQKYWEAKAKGDKQAAKKYGRSSRAKIAKGLVIKPSRMGGYDRFRQRGDSKAKALAKATVGGPIWN